MKSTGPLKHFLFAFIAAVVIYAVGYSWIEHRRTRNGPWEVRFAVESQTPAIIIAQPKLQIQNVRITFPGQSIATNFSGTLNFANARQWPFDVPFGKVIFLDTTFLPGNVTFELFGHEIQLLPRTLTIDRKEIPWQSSTNIHLQKIARTTLPL